MKVTFTVPADDVKEEFARQQRKRDLLRCAYHDGDVDTIRFAGHGQSSDIIHDRIMMVVANLIAAGWRPTKEGKGVGE